MNNVTKEQQIDEIMYCFDFERVKKVMDALDWYWDSTKGVPELWEIKKYAHNMMKNLVKNYPKHKSSECGGFKAKIEDGIVSLYFIVESWSGYDSLGDEVEYL